MEKLVKITLSVRPKENKITTSEYIITKKTEKRYYTKYIDGQGEEHSKIVSIKNLNQTKLNNLIEVITCSIIVPEEDVELHTNLLKQYAKKYVQSRADFYNQTLSNF